MTNGFGTVWSSALNRLAEVGGSSFTARRTSSKNGSHGLFFVCLVVLCVFFASTAHVSPVLLAALQPASLTLLQHISTVTIVGSQPVNYLSPNKNSLCKAVVCSLNVIFLPPIPFIFCRLN